jgi:hypothetical protein
LIFLTVLAAAFSPACAEPTCAVQVDGGQTGKIFAFRHLANELLMATEHGLFLYDGKRVRRAAGDPVGEVLSFFDSQFGLLLNTTDGLARFDGTRVTRTNKATGYVEAVQAVPDGLLVASANGLFRYDGSQLVLVERELTGDVDSFYENYMGLFLGSSKGLFRYYQGKLHPILLAQRQFNHRDIFISPDGLLISTDDGFFYYNGKQVSTVPGGEKLDVKQLQPTPDGLLLGTWNGVQRYAEGRIYPVQGDDTGSISAFYDTPQGLFLATEKGIFRYSEQRIVRIPGERTGEIYEVKDTSHGLLFATEIGLFRYDGKYVSRVVGAPTGAIHSIHRTASEVLLGADIGLFRYDGKRIVQIPSEPTGAVEEIEDFDNGVVLSADKGFFATVREPFSEAQVVLENADQLKGASPNKLGIPTHWMLTHPCATFAEAFGIQIAAVNVRSKSKVSRPAAAFHAGGKSMAFESAVPIMDDGDWIFRVVAVTTEGEIQIGKSSAPIKFSTPGFLTWLSTWWQLIVAVVVIILTLANLSIFFAARYSATAWRMATDASWSATMLLPQKLMLRYWQRAQLWLLDLYVRERHATFALAKSSPYLPLPLSRSDGMFVDTGKVINRLKASTHLWIQGGTGMGKTATYFHLCQAHFAEAKPSAFKLFVREGFVLVPFEARRFPDAPLDENGASGWVVSCVASVLARAGLSFDDRGILRAMLRKGTLGIAIDGLNEVPYGQSVLAFASEFSTTPLFITSHEGGEEPFETWRLPRSMSEHVGALCKLYLGAERGRTLVTQLSSSGLLKHLRSGYDVRLVVDLVESGATGSELPDDQIGLYRAAVSAAWPEADERLELLQAAAWKLVSERGPNEDKRRLSSEDLPIDLLERLETAQERSSRSIRLIRRAPPNYEFVHDQMNAYLAASWFVSRPTNKIMYDLLEKSNIWQDGLEAQRTLWGFVAVMLEQPLLEDLWVFAGNDERRAVLGRVLAEVAQQRGWPLVRRPTSKSRGEVSRSKK